MMKKLLPLFLVLTSGLLGAQDTATDPAPVKILETKETPTPADINLWLSLEAKAEEKFSTKEQIYFSSLSPLLDLRASISANSDKKYGADIANFKVDQTFMGNYFLLEEGSAKLKLLSFAFEGGRMKPQDSFVSPYSLFLNANPMAANSMVLHYEDPIFSYESRWIELNHRSHFPSLADTPDAWKTSQGFPDRGANLKTFLFKLGNFNLGIQDAAVYTQRNFDFEYFISPIPQYFTQYVKTTDGRPWTTSGNENNIIGGFLTWKEGDWDAGGQVLLDDFSLHFLFPDAVPNNPWKAAWSLGVRWQSPWGKLGLFHAGATKYTFEPITTQAGQENESAYGYSYYPDTEFFIDGAARPLPVQDYSLGYTHGENNFALMVTYENTLFEALKLKSSLEFVLAGANSPANPWHEDTYHNEVGTQWLNNSILEKRFLWRLDARYKLNEWEFYLLGTFGGIFDSLELKPVGIVPGSSSELDKKVKIFQPGGPNKGVFSLSMGVRYTWDITQIISGKGGQSK